MRPSVKPLVKNAITVHMKLMCSLGFIFSKVCIATINSMTIATICFTLSLSKFVIKARKKMPIGMPIYLNIVAKPTSFQSTYLRSLYVEVADWKKMGIAVVAIASERPNPLHISNGIAKRLKANPMIP